MSVRARTSALFGAAWVALVLLGAGVGASNSLGVLARDVPGRTVRPDLGSTPLATMSPDHREPTDSAPLPPRLVPTDVQQAVLNAAFAFAALALIAWLVAYLVRHPGRRARSAAAEPEPTEETGSYDAAQLSRSMREGASSTLADLDAGRVSASDAIIQCWRATVAAGTKHGIARRSTDTSTDYATRVLAETGVRPDTVETLAGLYRRAMFGAWRPGASDAERAASCLRDIVADLERRDA